MSRLYDGYPMKPSTCRRVAKLHAEISLAKWRRLVKTADYSNREHLDELLQQLMWVLGQFERAHEQGAKPRW